MKNKVFKALNAIVMCLICMVLFSTQAMAEAEEDVDWMIPITVQSKILPPDIKSSVAQMHGITRGAYFSTATLAIGNPEPGVIMINADVMCSSKVDKIYMKVYLDVNKNGKWNQVKSWSFTKYDVVVASVYMEYTDYEPNQIYRLRGAYAVTEGDIVENASGLTDGLNCE